MISLLTRLKAWVYRVVYRRMSRLAWADHSPGSGLKLSTLRVPVRHGELTARMYHGQQGGPLVVYFHGGGWCIGDLDTHDPFCRSLAAASGCTLMSVEYRLAPEHPFPAAHEDCLDVTHWILAHLNGLAPNNGKVVIAGDSAGGNLAAATVASLGTEPRLAGAMLIYPVTEHYMSGLPSYTEQARSGPLTSSIMRWFFDTYLAGLAPADPAARELFVGRRCDYQRFPPSLVITAERDPLRDDGRRLGIVMRQAGVTVTYHHYNDEAHGFACSEGPTEGHRHFIDLASHWLGGLTA